jgi:hypothetical protein
MDRTPTIIGNDIRVTVRHGDPVLLDKTAERVHDTVERSHANMIRAAWNRGSLEPAVARGVEDLVVRARDLSFTVSPDHVHARAFAGCPSHFAARQRQGRCIAPAARRRGLGRGAVGEALGEGIGRELRFVRVAQRGIESSALDRLHIIGARHLVGMTGGSRPPCEQIEDRRGGEPEMAAFVDVHELTLRHPG